MQPTNAHKYIKIIFVYTKKAPKCLEQICTHLQGYKIQIIFLFYVPEDGHMLGPNM